MGIYVLRNLYPPILLRNVEASVILLLARQPSRSPQTATIHIIFWHNGGMGVVVFVLQLILTLTMYRMLT